MVIVRVIAVACVATAVASVAQAESTRSFAARWRADYAPAKNVLPASDRGKRIARAAAKRVGTTLFYDPAYVGLAYPGGDVPNERGVCTDVVIRALRALGVDLQQLIHEHRRAHLQRYPKLWSQHTLDKNIDHRRVANMMVFFSDTAVRLPIDAARRDVRAGDLVVWLLDSGRLHIGVASSRLASPGRPMIIHNIGEGTLEQDVLLEWEILAAYRLKDG